MHPLFRLRGCKKTVATLWIAPTKEKASRTTLGLTEAKIIAEQDARDLLTNVATSHQEAGVSSTTPEKHHAVVAIVQRILAGKNGVRGETKPESHSSLDVGLWKMMREARSDELVTLTRSRHEALAIDDGHLLPATLNQSCIFQLPSSVRDRRPLYPEHFSEQILRDQQCVIVVAVSHHQQPAC